MSTVDSLVGDIDIAEEATAAAGFSGLSRKYGAKAGWSGWLFALPALVMYAVFVLYPILTSVQYSFYDWNGIGRAKWVGFDNYVEVFTDPRLLGSIGHAFFLIIFFTVLPILIGLLVASVVREIASKLVSATARTIMFLPYIIPGAAAAIAWTWMYTPNGAVNQLLVGVRPRVLDQGLAGRFHLGAARRRIHRDLGADRAVHAAVAVRDRQDRRDAV